MADIIPIAKNKRPSYENFVADCPLCGHECIFNRASDLHTFEPIGGLNVTCLNSLCAKTFRLISDSVNERHEMLIYDCYELLERKHYMNCILSLAQAYEVFFSLFLRVEFLYKPFAANLDQDLAVLNQLSEQLNEKIKDHTFSRMRALFLRTIIGRHSPTSLNDAAKIIAALPRYPTEPKSREIDAISDAKLIPLLRALKATTIHVLRNRVVHKQAYRPTHDQVQAALKETRSILFPLTSRLNLHDDLLWYKTHP